MTKSKLSVGTIHNVIPADLRTALLKNNGLIAAWQDITPLARNEWLCWVENAKLNETRKRRIERTVSELAEGIRRPCCWMGCIHRTDKAISASVKGILNKKTRSS